MGYSLKSILSPFKDNTGEVIPPQEEENQPEEMVSIEVVYEPDTVDAHGEWMSKETIRKACENFNKHLAEGVVQANLFHVKPTELFTIEKTWINEEMDVIVKDSGEFLKAGTWVAKLKYHDERLWKLRKAMVIQGVSIGGKGKVNTETGEITDVHFGE